MSTMEATSEQFSSDILVRRVGTWNPVLGAEGFRAGICLDITHRHTSSAAYTTDFSGMMSPSSPPSPRELLSEMSIDSELLVEASISFSAEVKQTPFHVHVLLKQVSNYIFCNGTCILCRLSKIDSFKNN